MPHESEGTDISVGPEPRTIGELIHHVTARLKSIGFLETGKEDAMGQKMRQGQFKESDWISLAEAAVRREERNDYTPSN